MISAFMKERQNPINQIISKRFSQYEEDTIIYDYFRSHDPDRKRRFLEIGAADGTGGSNCYKLALTGWGGVCVEANPFFWVKLFKQYQGSEIETVCACVGQSKGLCKFHLNDDGLATTNEAIFETLKSKTNFYGQCFAPCITPDDLVNAFGNDFDFVSIDAEGMDMEIVKSGLKLLENTTMLCVETDRPGKPREEDYQSEWKRILDAVGFTKVHHQTQGNTLLVRGL